MSEGVGKIIIFQMDPVAVAPFGFIDIDMGTPYPEPMPGYLIIGPVQILIGFDSVTGKITKPDGISGLCLKFCQG